MASSQLPTPGRLILENITLLAGSPTAFHQRYGFTLTPTTFSKAGNTAPANAVLHFLISIIDADVAESLFKPCFPILDRDQERDFRKVVDSRLAVLERTKLLPVGCARKSVVASAGGDRFLDLLWSLSSLALQQACLRHPAYASVSRMRLLSHQAQSDTSSQYSASQHPASRSSRSLLSGLSSRPERAAPDPSRHRRFLGVGMLSASQQRQKDAEEMRARIDSERIALNRTTEMGQHGAKTWASEADSLRERIVEFEAKLRRLKGQLADMGFDENGVDIRAKAAQQANVAAISETKPSIDGTTTGGPLVPSSSGDSLREELKTSPIESTESCSSIDDTGDACDDLAADLSRLLTFTVESEDQRADVEDALEVEKPLIPGAIASSAELLSGSEANMDEDAHKNPEDILSLVRVATDELEEVTNRMHEIREARERAVINELEDLQTDKDVDRAFGEERLESITNPQQQDEDENKTEKETEDEQDSALTERKEIGATSAQVRDNAIGSEPVTGSNEDTDASEPVPNIEEADSSVDTPAPLEQKVIHLLEEHNDVVESSRRLQKEAAMLSAKAMLMSTPEDDTVPADSSSRDTFVDAISKPHWYTNAVTNSVSAKKSAILSSGSKKHGKPPRGNVNTLSDVSVAAKAMQSYGPARSSTSRRRKEGTKSLDSINLDLSATDKRSASALGNEMDALYSPSESNSSLKGTPRIVRFAALPPSYSASRTSDNSREGSSVRDGQSSNELFVDCVNKALEIHPGSRNLKQPPINSAPEDNAEKEYEAKEGTSSPNSRSVCRSTRKSETMVRTDTQGLKSEKGRAGVVSSQKPPRVQRTRTPHRIVRPKDTMQRSIASRVKTQPGRPFSTRSPSLDSISSLRSSHLNVTPTKDFDHESLEGVESMRGEEKVTSADSQKETMSSAESPKEALNSVKSPKETLNSVESPKEAPKDIRSENMARDVKSETLSPQASDEEITEESSCEKKESLQKKLFMTPESAVSSSKTTRHLSQPTGESNAGVLHSSNRGNVASTNNSSEASDVTAVVKDSSVEFPSADDEDLLFSPAAKPSIRESSVPTKKVTGGGFFAGQAAEWQQSVRALSDAGRPTPPLSGRGLSEKSGRLGRKTSSSGMRSKVQSLRARLAALK